MSEFLDHAITVRDVIYTLAILFLFIGLVVGWLIWLLHPATMERRRLKRNQRTFEADVAKPGENVRNPAYSRSIPLIKKPQPTENHRNPAYGLKSKDLP